MRLPGLKAGVSTSEVQTSGGFSAKKEK